MNRKCEREHSGADTQAPPRRPREARNALGNERTDQLEPQPWQHGNAPASAVDLMQCALRRSSDLTHDELLGALSLIPEARREMESTEVALLFVARSEGLTWAQIAEAMGFRSPQACQQYVNRLSARQEKNQ